MQGDNSPIDVLIDKFNATVINRECIKCENDDKLFKMSCKHLICVPCMEDLINQNNYEKCPSCNSVLTRNIQKIFLEFISNPISKLNYYHNININDRVWYYSGNGHNWLYSNENNCQLNQAFDKYEEIKEDSLSQTQIQLSINNEIKTYVIDFELMVQYQKDNPSKARDVLNFKLTSKNDLKKNKIIGVAGKLL